MASDFTCLRCGNCCRHAGEVRLEDGEAETLARTLAITITAFTDRFTRLSADRRGLSLTERPDGTCVFLEEPSCTCQIHEAKPAQCRTFPVGWRYEDLEAVCAASQQRSGVGPS